MGALAYDVIGKTDKIFDESGPGLNCKVTGQQEFFGGCAGNIAYGLKLLKTPYLLLSAAGSEDFRRYAQHLNHQLDGILTVKGAHCARANIITDPMERSSRPFRRGPPLRSIPGMCICRTRPLSPWICSSARHFQRP
jgi:sugar/nucleoside kinase (ribokinase family)